MYDKTIRRRRAVLALLVAGSLILLTAHFGESSGGPLHTLQRGISAVAAPFEEGASRVFKPVRDTFSWFGDTISAKGDLKQTRKDLDTWRRRAIAGQDSARRNQQLEGLLQLRNDNSEYRPVNARVIVQSPTLWYTTISIDKGTSAGIEKDMPVMASDGRDQGTGLVGVVSEAASDTAKVTLITDHSISVSAVLAQRTVRGVLQASVGDPNRLEMQFLGPDDDVRTGDYVVTSGTTSTRTGLQSKYPPGLPVGRVSSVTDAGTDAIRVLVEPFVNMKRIDFVQVLTRRVDGNRR